MGLHSVSISNYYINKRCYIASDIAYKTTSILAVVSCSILLTQALRAKRAYGIPFAEKLKTKRFLLFGPGSITLATLCYLYSLRSFHQYTQAIENLDTAQLQYNGGKILQIVKNLSKSNNPLIFKAVTNLVKNIAQLDITKSENAQLVHEFRYQLGGYCSISKEICKILEHLSASENSNHRLFVLIILTTGNFKVHSQNVLESNIIKNLCERMDDHFIRQNDTPVDYLVQCIVNKVKEGKKIEGIDQIIKSLSQHTIFSKKATEIMKARRDQGYTITKSS